MALHTLDGEVRGAVLIVREEGRRFEAQPGERPTIH
jgi:hypothetical protein